MIKDQNRKAKILKILEENLSVNLLEPKFDNFLKNILKTQATKGKIDELDIGEIKTFCFKGFHQESRKTIDRMDRMEENIYKSYIYLMRELCQNIHRKLMQLNSLEATQLKMGKEPQ